MSDVAELTDRLESLQAEIKKYKADILQHVTTLYSPTPNKFIDLKNDPRYAVQVTENTFVTHACLTAIHADRCYKMKSLSS